MVSNEPLAECDVCADMDLRPAPEQDFDLISVYPSGPGSPTERHYQHVYRCWMCSSLWVRETSIESGARRWFRLSGPDAREGVPGSRPEDARLN